MYENFRDKRQLHLEEALKFKEIKKIIEREETELYLFCNSEITSKGDIEKDGYQIECTECGEKIMLGDASLHSEDNREERCDWTMENGCFRKKKESRK